jgi:hypothetical protein
MLNGYMWEYQEIRATGLSEKRRMTVRNCFAFGLPAGVGSCFWVPRNRYGDIPCPMWIQTSMTRGPTSVTSLAVRQGQSFS